MRRSEDNISRTILNWKPMGKDYQGGPGKGSWMLWKNTLKVVSTGMEGISLRSRKMEGYCDGDQKY